MTEHNVGQRDVNRMTDVHASLHLHGKGQGACQRDCRTPTEILLESIYYISLAYENMNQTV